MLDIDRITRTFAASENAYAGKLTPGQWGYFLSEFAGAEGEPEYFAIALRDRPEWVLAFFTRRPDWMGDVPTTAGREVAATVRTMIETGYAATDSPCDVWVSRAWRPSPEAAEPRS